MQCCRRTYITDTITDTIYVLEVFFASVRVNSVVVRVDMTFARRRF